MTGTSQRPLALVTGASSGIGWAYAERLASEGFDLVVVARRGERLEQLKEKLEDARGVSVEPLATDLSTEEGMQAVERRAIDQRLAMVVDNAAELARLNALGPLRLIRAALPGMV